ncbi:MAG: exosortase/archaeosortase family protein [Desulfobulbus sp.]
MHTTLSSLRSTQAYLLLFLVSAALIGIYFPILVGLTQDWSTNDNYSHGYFIPFISGYMAYSMLGELRKLPSFAANWGLLFLIAGLGQLYIASVGSEFFLQRTSLIPVLLGISLFLWGTLITRKLLLPIFYLLFMIPLPAIIWNKIAFPMQLFSSAITEEIVRLMGIPIFREGNVLHLSQTTLEVIDACSGLRSLTTMLALAAALAWFTDFTQWKKWALFFLAAPVAILANIVRLTATAGLASVYGEKVAQGFLHEFSGLFTFVFGLMLLVFLNRLLHKN